MIAPRGGQPPRSPGERFRVEIDHVRASGADLDGYVLKLSRGDASRLRRDKAVPEADIRYCDGRMHFLGVPVEEGGSANSVLAPVGAPSHAGDAAADWGDAAPAKARKKAGKAAGKSKAVAG